MIDAETVVLRVGLWRHEHLLPGREPVAREGTGDHGFGVGQGDGATKLVVEEPEGLRLENKMEEKSMLAWLSGDSNSLQDRRVQVRYPEGCSLYLGLRYIDTILVTNLIFD